MLFLIKLSLSCLKVMKLLITCIPIRLLIIEVFSAATFSLIALYLGDNFFLKYKLITKIRGTGIIAIDAMTIEM